MIPRMLPLTSWNKNPTAYPLDYIEPNWEDECEGLIETISSSYICYGMGRSYGDCCLPNQGISLQTKHLNHFIHFNETTGVLRLEAGTTIKKTLQFFIPKGWVLPVLPGTQYVTIGGAIANDVHGKNHSRRGTFGCSVLKIALLRSETGVTECSPFKNNELFCATIGGLGMTGLILWAEIQLMKIQSPLLQIESQPFYSLDDYFELTQAAENTHEYVAAWIDCLATGKNIGRGILSSANWHTSPTETQYIFKHKKNRLKIPFYFPSCAMNSFNIYLFNRYYFSHHKTASKKIAPYDTHLFPLDGISDWNKLYGKKGFFQYQCVIPENKAKQGVKDILKEISASKQGSFLAVLKNFGGVISPGMLSFPMHGTTLALDFPNQGNNTLQLFNRLDNILLHYGGRLYPAKDARMSPDLWRKTFSIHGNFSQYIDPLCDSLFWSRVFK